MRIDSAGNVGIGTSTPAALLDLGVSTGQKLLMYRSSNIKYGQAIETSEYRMFAEDQANMTFGHMARSDGTTYTERMRIDVSGYTTIVDATNGDLRLGEVTGTPGLYSPDGNGMAFRSDNIGANPAFTFSNGTVERMRIADTGNVGIGTSSPSSLIDVRDDSGTTPQIKWGRDGLAHSSLFCDQFGTTILSADATNVGAASSLGFHVDAVERMRIDPDGNVAIGETPPADAKLSVRTAGADSRVRVRCSGGPDNDAVVELFPTSSNGAQGYSAVKGIGTGGALGQMSFHTGDSSLPERMRIDSSGNVLVGKTVANAGTTPGVEVNSSGVLYCSYSGTQPAAHFNRGSNGTGLKFTVGYIDAGGVTFTQNGTPSFVAASDERLKENITDHESELANVMALRPVRWDWKANDNSGEGFIAQEIQETAWADLVSEGDDGMLQVSGLGTVETRLIKAMQEQQAMIEELKAEVEALKNA
jgi:hypothetical protein